MSDRSVPGAYPRLQGDSVIPFAAHIGILLASLLIILLGAELFTNGVEWVGKHLRLSEGAVGSVLAAVGTALPETMIPVIAIFLGSHSSASHDVGIGAIAGAPFMLATLAFCVTGASVYVWAASGRRTTVVQANAQVMRRDLGFFLIAYAVAVAATLLHEHRTARIVVALGLVAVYAVYVRLTLKDESPMSTEDIRRLHLSAILRVDGRSAPPALIYTQIAAALALIVGGAHLFVEQTVFLSNYWHVPPTILSLLIAPVATELPEKANSVLWTRERKDTLALGNITGALVFQSCLPVAIGVAFTPWKLEHETLLSAGLALLSATIVYCVLRVTGRIPASVLLLGGVLYAVFVTYVVVQLT